MKDREVVLCHPVRTAIGTFGGSLKQIPATDLGAAVIRETIRRSQLDATVGAVIMGNVIQAGNRMNPARQAALHAGVAVSVPALTVNRVCGSGAQAILSAAQEIQLGNMQVAIAGGMENMDRAPYLLDGGRWGYRMGDAGRGSHSPLRSSERDWPARELRTSAFGTLRTVAGGPGENYMKLQDPIIPSDRSTGEHPDAICCL